MTVVRDNPVSWTSAELGAGRAVNANLATATGAANGATTMVSRIFVQTFGQAAGAAFVPSITVFFNTNVAPGDASGAGAAFDSSSVSATTNVTAAAAATGAALDAVATGLVVNNIQVPSEATATGVAFNATGGFVITADAVGVAFDTPAVTIASNINAGTATAAGVANNGAPTNAELETAFAQDAVASGVAFDVPEAAESAAATGTAFDALSPIISSNINVPAAAAATGAAFNAGATTTQTILVPSEASATGVANDVASINRTSQAFAAAAAGAGLANVAAPAEAENITPPSISSPGNSWAAGDVWTATTGTWWSGASGFAYQWQQSATANGTYTSAAASDPGGSATTASYAPPVASTGLFYRVRVTATGTLAGASASALAFSAAQQSVVVTGAPVNTSTPVLSSPNNNWEVNTAWTCSTGSWTGASTFAYQWRSSLTSGGTYAQAVASAAGGGVLTNTYVPPASETGKFFHCRVTATGPGGSTQALSNVHQAIDLTPPNDSLVPTTGAWFGVTAATTGTKGGTSPSGLSAWLSATGQHYPHIISEYMTGTRSWAWSSTQQQFYRPTTGIHAGKKAIPLIHWKIGPSWQSIANGGSDAAITQFVNGVREWPGKFFCVLPHHEPELEITQSDIPTFPTQNTNAGNRCIDYINMHRHFVDRVRAGFAPDPPNMEFVVQYTGYSNFPGNNSVSRPGIHSFELLFAGEDWVDWIGWDPYPHSFNRDTWLTPRPSLLNETLSGTGDGHTGFYDWARATHPNTPLMLTEWGLDVTTTTGMGQANVSTVLNGYRTGANGPSTTPMVKAVVYWNSLTGNGDYQMQNTTCGDEMGALIASPWFTQDVAGFPV